MILLHYIDYEKSEKRKHLKLKIYSYPVNEKNILLIFPFVVKVSRAFAIHYKGSSNETNWQDIWDEQNEAQL